MADKLEDYVKINTGDIDYTRVGNKISCNMKIISSSIDDKKAVKRLEEFRTAWDSAPPTKIWSDE